MSDRIEPGSFSPDLLDRIIRESHRFLDAGERIVFLSGRFLNVGYSEGTLIGDKDTPEEFVINLGGVDCMTFVEYVEAMRLSGSYADFESNLKMVRYKSGIVDFSNRKHFFTEWRESSPGLVDDVTEEIGGRGTSKIMKNLNVRKDGTHYVSGIKPVLREIAYISSPSIDDHVLRELRSGDYVGIYSDPDGLDVSHVGIVVRKEMAFLLRHASSQERYRKVVDQDLKAYIENKPGIIVFRPRNSQAAV